MKHAHTKKEESTVVVVVIIIITIIIIIIIIIINSISSVDGRVVSMETDPDFTNTSHPSCSLIGRSVVKDEQPMEEEKWKSLLQGNLEEFSEDQRGQFSSLVTEYEDINSKDSSDLRKSCLLEHHPTSERLLMSN